MDAGRRDAFERLCHDEYARVVRTAWLVTGDREEAMDLAQEAFARAWQRWSSVAAADRPGAWLQRTVTNLALSWRRRMRVRSRPVPNDAAFSDDEGSSLFDLLRTLTPAQRAVIVLRYYVDQSVEDTAKALGKRPGTVRALTSQALARLRTTLTPEEIHEN